MRDLRNNRKKIIILIIIFIIILCILFKISQSKNLNIQEDLIFFKLFGISNMEKVNIEKGEEREKIELTKENRIIKNIESIENKFENVYKIEVKEGKENYQDIDLFQTIDANTLVNEKIAPGTKGKFYVYLSSNSDIDYEMEIVGKNISPKNFKFEISNKEGSLEKNKVKKVEVNWEWPYEINEEENIQDTKDGKNIEKYNFEICTIGK